MQKLELEGNLLANESAAQFAVLLENNNTLRYLDLSNNNLTNQGQSRNECMALAKALGTNKSLLYLNLSNNMLEETIGTEFVKYTDINRDLICFEFAFNQFILIQVQEIIKNIKRNKAAYDALRL